MNECIISIGSNKNRETNIESTMEKLKGYFNQIIFSDILATEPIETPPGTNPYLNVLALAYTEKQPDEIIRFFKDMELSMGRLPVDKLSHTVLIDIDIDLLQWNDQILKSRDFTRKYVKDGLNNLNRKTDLEINIYLPILKDHIS